MRILVDYRPALRARTGVGEYVHELLRAYTSVFNDPVTLFTSSLKDRPDPHLGRTLNADVVDRRIPVTALNFLWHRQAWPPVEWLAGACDVVHAAHPLRIPARRAAQIVTIHDLFFMTDAHATDAEIRRDYPTLAAAHASAAHAIVTSTAHGKRLVETAFGVPGERIHVCPAGAPTWERLGGDPSVPQAGYVLFLGTMEPRKNVGRLLDAWQLLVGRGIGSRLVIAGAARGPVAAQWLERIRTPPLAGSVEYRGYVEGEQREALYAGARALVLPSLDEGFGLTALEAMSAGVPLIASNRGSLPEVVADAGMLLDPMDVPGLADALAKVIDDNSWAAEMARRGLHRARAFSWTASAEALRGAYLDALARKRAELESRADSR